MINKSKIFSKYRELNNDEKGLLFIRGIRGFETLVKWVFVNIYIFLVQQSIYDVLWFNIIGYICTTIGYWSHWFLASRKKINVKRSLQLSFLIALGSYILLILFGNHTLWILLYVIINGVSRWFFYSSMIYFESHNIKDKKTDIYWSFMQALKKVVWIIWPIIVAGFFILQNKMGISGYKLIFGLNIVVLIWMIIYSNKLSNHIIPKINFKRLMLKTFNFKEILYYLTFWLSHAGAVIMALVLIYILKSEVNIWFYETILAVLSIVLVLWNSIKTNGTNRKRNITIVWVLMFINTLLFGINLTVIWLTIYTIVNIIVAPLLSAMKFAYYFNFIENEKDDKQDKFVRVIHADGRTQLWRVLLLLVIIAWIYLVWTETALTTAMIMYAFVFLLNILVIRSIEKKK